MKRLLKNYQNNPIGFLALMTSLAAAFYAYTIQDIALMTFMLVITMLNLTGTYK